jgi:hypothetical protein
LGLAWCFGSACAVTSASVANGPRKRSFNPVVTTAALLAAQSTAPEIKRAIYSELQREIILSLLQRVFLGVGQTAAFD